mgnify:CR=1 FL=1
MNLKRPIERLDALTEGMIQVLLAQPVSSLFSKVSSGYYPGHLFGYFAPHRRTAAPTTGLAPLTTPLILSLTSKRWNRPLRR